MFVGKKLDIFQKVDALNNVFIPNHDIAFPKNPQMRNLRFQYSWLHKFKWLSYSKTEDAAFCKFCVIFGPESAGKGNQDLKQLVKQPFRNWKKALEIFKNHQDLQYYKNSLLDSESTSLIIKNKQESISVQIDKQRKDEIERNRKYLKPIIETILLCGRQGLSLRGHRDDGRIDPKVDPEQNDGNFRAILRFKIRDDEELCHLFKTQNKTILYTSKTTQNKIIEINNLLILKKLVLKIKDSGFFSILADETTDIATQEQMSLCIRIFNNQTMHIEELFLQFYIINDLTREGLANSILKAVTELGLDPIKIRG